MHNRRSLSAVRRLSVASILLYLIAVLSVNGASGAIIYVDSGATGLNDGTSWMNAYTDLQDALGPASTGDEIWVAAGTYLPHSSDRAVSFVMKSGVGIYGGFNGTETMRSQRDYLVNITTLSGDIGTPSDNTDNTHHVVQGSSVDSTGVLDGFTIRDGFADGSAMPSGRGGGVLITLGNPTIANLTVTQNTATVEGGGMSLLSSFGTVTGCTFVDNQSDFRGGALLTGGASTLRNIVVFDNHADFVGGGVYALGDFNADRIINAAFIQNTAERGGAIAVGVGASGVQFVNVAVDRNAATLAGGGVHNDGVDPTFVNLSFSGNVALSGGAMWNIDSNPTIINTLMWGDIATSMGSPNEISNDMTSTPVISYSDIEGSNGSGGSWDTGLGTDAGNNIDADPLYTNPSGGGLALMAGSPAIDVGNSAANSEPLDGFGALRIQGAVIDMGAYESSCPSPQIVYVDASAVGANNGTSWADAFTDLPSALASTLPCAALKEIWVRAFIYTPGTMRSDSFVLRDSTAVYGGFNGTETARDQRDFVAHVTTLSGDVGMLGDDTDNSYHVVVGSGVGSTAVLDGFQIVNGNANGSLSSEKSGGGIYTESGSPTLSNLHVWLNAALENGGGLYNTAGGNPMVTMCNFDLNTAEAGAGVFNSNSSPAFLNVIFHQNAASFIGGGACNFFLSDPTYTNVLFLNNTALAAAGMGNVDRCNPTVTNATFSSNVADDTGGGIASDDDCIVTLVNSVVWGNTATNDPEVFNGIGSDAVISYSDIEGCNGSGGSWNTAIGTDAGNNIDANPDFVNTGAEDYRILPSSPAIDVGNNAAPNIAAVDLDNRYRLVGGIVDMGAYEYNPVTGIDDSKPGVPVQSSIRSAYPNPFNPTLTVMFDLAQTDEVFVTVYDVAGRRCGHRHWEHARRGRTACSGMEQIIVGRRCRAASTFSAWRPATGRPPARS